MFTWLKDKPCKKCLFFKTCSIKSDYRNWERLDRYNHGLLDCWTREHESFKQKIDSASKNEAGNVGSDLGHEVVFDDNDLPL